MDYFDTVLQLDDLIKNDEFMTALFAPDASIADVLNEYMPREAPYSDQEQSEIYVLIDEYKNPRNSADDRATLLDALADLWEGDAMD